MSGHQTYIWIVTDEGTKKTQIAVATGGDEEEARSKVLDQARGPEDPLRQGVEADPDYILDQTGGALVIE